MNNYYETLGISKDATQDDVKKAYRKMSKKYHPDVNGGDDVMFKKLNDAYSVLGDTNKRREHDTPAHSFSGGAFHDDFFNSFFNQRRQRATMRGSDIKLDLSITVEESLLGLEKEIKYYRMTQNFNEELRTVKIKVPVNADDGNMFRVRGGGNLGDKMPGDLIVIVNIISDGIYEREGNNLIYHVTMNPIDVLLGKEILIDLFTSKIKVNTPACLKVQFPMRVRGKGIQTMYGRGDLFLKFKVSTPNALTDTEIRLLEELKKGDNFKG